MTFASYDDVRRAARRRVPRAVFEFVDGGAGAETTLRSRSGVIATT